MHFFLATEDELSEAVGLRLMKDFHGPCTYNIVAKAGKSVLRGQIQKYCEIAAHYPFILLTDLDRELCPTNLINDWMNGRSKPNSLIFRVASKEIESWLLADHDGMTSLLGPKVRRQLPNISDNLLDAKEVLINLARLAPREIRQDLIKKDGNNYRQGYGYNIRLSQFISEDWNPQRAALHSESLRRAITRLREIN